MESDGFTIVRKKGKKNPRTTIIHHNAELRDPLDIAKAMAKIKVASEELRSSEFCHKLSDLLRKCGDCEAVWCFGLGHFGECITARYQLAALLFIKVALGVNQVFVSDPIFYQEEVDILKKLKLTVVRQNLECLVKCNSKTLVYLPHCPKQLSNNLLYSNWDLEGLENLVLLGNSFQNTVERTSTKMLDKNANLIKIAVENNLVMEVPLKNCFKYDDVFNDTSLHTFAGSELLEKDFWKVDKPVYDPMDTEFIKADN
jgi:hypothetical protein